MIKKLLAAGLPLVALFIFTSLMMSDDGRAGRTGSPGELTCTDCHDDFALNSGGGSISIQSPGMTGFEYTPGQTYNMSVTVARSANSLFGVGIEALTSTNTNAGLLVITDAASTQIKNMTVSGVSRRNVVHTLNGGANPASKVFNFNWTAPAVGTGNITFYFAGVAANASGTNNGDYVYASSQPFTEAACAAPSQPGTITGATDVCNGAGESYSIAAIAGATSYTWTLPGGWSGTSTSTSINVTTGSSSGNITVKANNACGSSIVSSLAVSTSVVNATESHTNVSCNGGNDGSATVTPSGGTGPYTFSWSPSGGSAATASNLTAGNYTATFTDASGCTGTKTVNITQPAVLGGTKSSTNITCNGLSNGTATVTATGGTSPYQYNWTPSGGTSASTNNLAAGNYSVVVTDNHSCTASFSYAITEPTAITITTSTSDATCGLANGNASAIPGGGTPSFFFSWTTTPTQHTALATNLSAGNYIVTVTDQAGCTGTKSVTVNQLSSLNASGLANNVSCHGGTNGSAIVIGAGGAPGYTYSWNTVPPQLNDTAVNLPSGTYTATVTDVSGCSFSTSVNVTEPSTLIVNAGVDVIICEGASAQLGGSPTASGGTPPYTYEWSPASSLISNTIANPDTYLSGSTVFTLSVTDNNNCPGKSSVSVVTNPLPTPSISSGNDTLFSTAGVAFVWYLDGNMTDSTTVPFIIASQNGNYSVTVYDSVGCSGSSPVFSFTTLGIPVLNNELEVFPNPFTDRLTISSTHPFSTFTIYNGTGNIVKEILLSETNEIDVSDLSEGFYLLTIRNNDFFRVFRILKLR